MITFGGIDPGTTGAMAVMDGDGNPYTIFDYPGEPGQLWKILNDKFLTSLEMKLVVLEQAAIMPMERENAAGKKFKQNPKSLAIFQQNYGIWLMGIAAIGWPLELAHPMRWRKVLDSSVPDHPTKEDLLAYARRRWPSVDFHRKADNHRAEALMMAEYGRQKFIGLLRKGEK